MHATNSGAYFNALALKPSHKTGLKTGCKWPVTAGHKPYCFLGECVMTRFDLTPLYRSSVGFDRFASLLDSVGGPGNDATTYPPYNIERLSENEYQITMAVAGFGKDDLTIEVKENALTVTGEKKDGGRRHCLSSSRHCGPRI